ncbi:gamma-glutamylcyclotransferase family protein [Candidatus Spongiihabitans sp.]|uniref:gamma-glutamylcyclotransferase family protein n=1 Tax=Candidatus Spongiihabitans sp. TaxID=3101308 RepID=UPI003C7E1075
MTAKIYYFAYGSNLHPERLSERGIAAREIGVGELNGHRLAFHKKSTYRHENSSGKCNLAPAKSDTDSVHGVIYEITADDKKKLDKIEGKGHGYEARIITARHHDRDYSCFTYFAQRNYIDDSLKPYHWYKELVVLGAKHWRFPDDYVAAIEAVASVADPDDDRRCKKENLLRKIKVADKIYRP